MAKCDKHFYNKYITPHISIITSIFNNAIYFNRIYAIPQDPPISIKNVASVAGKYICNTRNNLRSTSLKILIIFSRKGNAQAYSMHKHTCAHFIVRLLHAVSYLCIKNRIKPILEEEKIVMNECCIILLICVRKQFSIPVTFLFSIHCLHRIIQLCGI